MQHTRPGVQLAGKSAQQIAIGPIAAGATTSSKILGFNEHPQANIDFWLELPPDPHIIVHKLKRLQARVTTPCRLQVMGSPVKYEDDATWECKIETVNSGDTIESDKVKLEVQHLNMDTNEIDTDDAQLLYKNNPITELAGISLDDIAHTSFSIRPGKIHVDTEDEMFVISLEYGRFLRN